MSVRARVLLAALTFALPLHAAENEPRLAVVIMAEADPALSDDLTEVAIAKLAGLGQAGLVGARELRSQWRVHRPSSAAALELEACLESTECCAVLGRTLNLSRAVVGRVKGRDAFAVEVARVELATGRAETRASRSDLVGLDQLIHGVADAVGELTATVAEAGQSVATTAKQELPRAPGLDAAPVARASMLASNTEDTSPATGSESAIVRARSRTAAPFIGSVADRPVRRSVPVVALTGVGLTVVTFAVAALTGSIAAGTPSGATRAQAQMDLERRKSYARATNGLLVAGAVLSGATGAAFVWHYRF